MSDTEKYRELCKKAQLLVRQQRFDDAISLFQQAAEVDKFDADCHEGMGTAFFMKGDHERSCQEFKRTTELDPRRGRAYVNLGAVYNRLGKFKDAAAALRKAVQKERKSAQAYYNLGIAQKGLNQLSMAVSAYKEALRIDPQMAEAHQNLGNVYLEMKNLSQASRCFNKALEIRPGFERAMLGIRQVKAAQEEKKNSFSPFGRLVNEDSLKDVKQVSYKRLSPEDQFQDRKFLREQATDARDVAKEFLEFLQEDLAVSVADLTSVFVQNSGSSSMLVAGESFLEEYAVFKGIRERMEKPMQLIQKHEDGMKA